jgi:hypothetical protein
MSERNSKQSVIALIPSEITLVPKQASYLVKDKYAGR